MPATKDIDVARGRRIPKGRENRESMRRSLICSSFQRARLSASSSSAMVISGLNKMMALKFDRAFLEGDLTRNHVRARQFREFSNRQF